MSKGGGNRILSAMEAHADVGRGDVSRWLKKNKRRVRAVFKSTGAGWDGVVAALADAGINNRDGKPPNRKSVPRVWARVCTDEPAATAKRAETATATSHRSRRSSDWQPDSRPSSSQPPLSPAPLRQQVLSREPQQPMQAASPPSASGSSKKGKLDDLPPEVKAKFDKLRKQLAETNRTRFGTF
jgi:hypothetical protein